MRCQALLLCALFCFLPTLGFTASLAHAKLQEGAEGNPTGHEAPAARKPPDSRAEGVQVAKSAATAYPPAAQSPDERMETLIVTAHRLPAKHAILPVTRIEPDGEPLTGIDVLRRLPNLAISQSGSFGGITQVRLRGSEANHTLVLIDGVEANDPANGGGYDFTHFMPFAGAAIEFLPGAQSAIWGSDALAGVIHLSTKPTAPARTLKLEGGAFGAQTGAIQLADRAEHGYYNLAVLASQTDGVNISRTGSEKDGYEHFGWQASRGWLQDRWSLNFILRGIHAESDYDPTPFPTFRPNDGDRMTSHDELLAGLAAQWEGDNWRQQLKLDYLSTDNGDFNPSRKISATEGERFKIAYNAGYRINPSHEIQGFVEHQNEQFSQRADASPFGDPNQSQRLEELSAGLEYLGCLGERLHWSASARLDANDDFDDAFTRRIAIRYQVAEGGDIWVNYGEGIKNPTFIERYGYTPNTFIGNPDLEPESNEHISLGASVTTHQAVLRLALFEDRLKNEIDGFYFDSVAGGFTAINQAGKSKRRGIEASASAQLGSVHLSGGWAYLRAREDDGSVEIRRPKHSGHLTATYDRGRLLAQVSAHFVGNRDDLSFVTFPATRMQLKDYQLLRMHARWRLTPKIDLTMRLENLLDDQYEDVLGYQAPGRAGYFGIKLKW